MNTTARKKPSSAFPVTKLRSAIRTAIPKGVRFEIRVADSGIGKTKIVRVVTPAWKTLRPAVRIEKVLDAVGGRLSRQEQDKILRFSVLTPDEYREIVPAKQTAGK
jgi:hypothetical protein